MLGLSDEGVVRGNVFITEPKGVRDEDAEEEEAEDGMCVYSIIAAVSHCGADTARKHVSRWVFLRVWSLQSPAVYLFIFPPASRDGDAQHLHV